VRALIPANRRRPSSRIGDERRSVVTPAWRLTLGRSLRCGPGWGDLWWAPDSHREASDRCEAVERALGL